MQHERVVGTERYIHALTEELGEGVLVVVEEKLVVAQGGHGDADLREVVQVLQAGILSKQDAVVDLMRTQVGGHEVDNVAGLSAVRAELEGT